MSLQQLKQEVNALPSADKTQLLRQLIEEMDGQLGDNEDSAWIKEAKGRYEEIRNGIVKTISATDVIEKAKRRLSNVN